MNILEYSNGWGHLIMSIMLLVCAMMLILFPGTTSDLHAVGVSLILTASGAWFIPGAAKQVLSQVQNNSNKALTAAQAQTPVQQTGGGNQLPPQ